MDDTRTMCEGMLRTAYALQGQAETDEQRAAARAMVETVRRTIAVLCGSLVLREIEETVQPDEG